MERLRQGILLIFSMITICGLICPACHLNRMPDVHFETTPQDVVEEMLEMAKVNENDMVYDLGCGDGRFVITAVKKFGARGVGIDIDPDRVEESRKKAIEAGVTDRVKFVEADLFKTDISEATVITLYLLQDLNLKLRPKLLRELKPGSRVLSYVFHMGDWKPDAMKPLGMSSSYFYLWVIPANVEGIWRGNDATQKSDLSFSLRLKQNFQEIWGNVTFEGGKRVRLREAKLIGDQVRFMVKYEGASKQKVVMQFNGRVDGETLRGSIDVTDGSLSKQTLWIGKRQP